MLSLTKSGQNVIKLLVAAFRFPREHCHETVADLELKEASDRQKNCSALTCHILDTQTPAVSIPAFSLPKHKSSVPLTDDIKLQEIYLNVIF